MKGFKLSPQAFQDVDNIWEFIAKDDSYLIIYRPESRPIEIVRVLHSARDVQRLIQEILTSGGRSI